MAALLVLAKVFYIYEGVVILAHDCMDAEGRATQEQLPSGDDGE